MLVVVHTTEREEVIRIISARKAIARKRNAYEREILTPAGPAMLTGMILRPGYDFQRCNWRTWKYYRALQRATTSRDRLKLMAQLRCATIHREERWCSGKWAVLSTAAQRLTHCGA
ncbi:MAG: hypothetical protein H6646_09105 [Anaerolineales bacterium]|nr:hypothetical protein [Anaerolineales bacterium]